MKSIPFDISNGPFDIQQIVEVCGYRMAKTIPDWEGHKARSWRSRHIGLTPMGKFNVFCTKNRTPHTPQRLAAAIVEHIRWRRRGRP